MRDWLDSIDARNRAQAKYDKANTAGVYMKLNIHTDLDVIKWLWRQPSKQGAIKRLIREEIARESSGRQNPARTIKQIDDALKTRQGQTLDASRYEGPLS